MKIVEIREKTIPISSPIRNAYIDFSKMTLSLVAVITDVIRDGRPARTTTKCGPSKAAGSGHRRSAVATWSPSTRPRMSEAS